MYKCLKKKEFADRSQNKLLHIRQEDFESIRQWRNEQIAILRQQTPITIEAQQRYWHETIVPSFESDAPKQILFSYFHQNTLIGYGGLTYIDWISRRAEISFLVATPRNHPASEFQTDFRHFLKLLIPIAFKELHLHRLMAETYEFRLDIIPVLEESGFLLEGILRDHVYKEGKWINSLIHGLISTEA